jgi:D-threonate/D-erythronate kinase
MHAAMRVTIVADDLTGACDTGALYTLNARVPVTLFPAARAVGDVAVIDTETRSLPPAEARARIAAVAARSGNALWFKKIDSTFRGRVGDEVDALLASAGLTSALVCPAFPAQERTVVARQLLVAGVPVDRTPFSADPDLALNGADIVAGLAAVTRRRVEWSSAEAARRSRLPLTPGGIVVADAETDRDLDALVAAALADPSPPLLVGSAGLAAALARRLGLTAPPPTMAAGLKWILVAGSQHPATRAQIARAAESRSRVLASAAAPSRDRRAAAIDLARQARKIIENEPIDLVAVTGGETAAALYYELDADRIELEGAPVPGVALGWLCRGEDFRVRILTKAGGFGDPDLFQRLMR